MLLLFLLEENSLENKPFVVEDFCSFSETTCLLLFTFRVGEQRKQERGTRERNVSESASAFARGDNREYERERKRCFLVSNVFPPAGNQSRVLLSMYKMRGGQERSKE